MSDQSLEADPMPRSKIRRLASLVKREFGLEDQVFIDVVEILELYLPQKIPNFTYDYINVEHMDDTHGFAKPDEHYIAIREDVYLGACKGVGRDRATIMHEVGHLLMHTSNRMRYPSVKGRIAAYKYPEWQAKAFAGEFLVAAHLVENYSSIAEVSKQFGVSFQSAKYQLQQLLKEGIIKRGQIKDLTPQ